MKEGWAEAVSDKPRSGRTRAISEEQLEEIKSFFKAKRGASLREVQAHFADTMGWNLPLSTLDRTLHMYTTLRPLKPKVTPNLAASKRHRRVSFALKFAGEDWECVLFTDESLFRSRASAQREK